MECGIDIVKIDRMVELSKNPAFVEKYFTLQEKEYLLSKNDSPQTMAGLYAAKEAVLKAFGLGIGGGIDLKDINILHQNGKPQIEVTPKINYYLVGKNCTQISVSISHDGDYAIAMCVLSNWIFLENLSKLERTKQVVPFLFIYYKFGENYEVSYQKNEYRIWRNLQKF